MKNSLKILALIGVNLAIVLTFTTHVTDAESGPQGITVSPAFQQVSVAADAAQQPVNFTISNNKSTPQTLELSVSDFNALSESGGLFFVGTNPTQLQAKYGLAKWISLPQNKVTIAPGQSVKLNAQILNLPTLESGGHYGALMLAIDNGDSSPAVNSIGIHPIASSLLFVTKQGGDTHKLNLKSVSFKRNIFKLPSSVNLNFSNDGNTHLIPRGLVTISDPRGNLISKGIINQDSDFILPQNQRLLNVPLSSVSHGRWPGQYHLSVQYRFDGFSGFRTYQANLLIITPAQFLLYLSGLVIIVLMGLLIIKNVAAAGGLNVENFWSNSLICKNTCQILR